MQATELGRSDKRSKRHDLDAEYFEVEGRGIVYETDPREGVKLASEVGGQLPWGTLMPQ
ncbi:uncharacterized protein VDAG_10531 [Verticillium dahliae VdLs.17]|uniref:Uncharacterized protein n=1 Tax=Verticillium dahliae (strain VdLs.17 / ATCC MYA-4575 / FGSC 10137) TaxID=498257 RepID=G2XK49_VERDV|nr:uncharacterized protein VDAG_10531 [Verticillium dahliae VdLs.17]EGY21549.1 hypothetical protein VDAG_10531 [Verticillium dahliae VdLs.17]KAH6672117.1 hypothetical protein EV126DRAFT_351783 [Verticillium dahliae]KAH6706738.1 hypothetical protein EV126DRAFT_333459 [Verticillium dahliae]